MVYMLPTMTLSLEMWPCAVIAGPWSEGGLGGAGGCHVRHCCDIGQVLQIHREEENILEP